MLAHPTLDKLNAMGLAGMAKAFGELVANGESEHLSHAEWLGLLLEREWSSRYDRKLAARLRFAKLRHQATPEDVDYRADRGLDRALFMSCSVATGSTPMTIWPRVSERVGWLALSATRLAETIAQFSISVSQGCLPSLRSRVVMAATPACNGPWAMFSS